MDAVIVTGASAKEIAALVRATQGRLDLTFASEDSVKVLAQAICDRQQGLQAQPDS